MLENITQDCVKSPTEEVTVTVLLLSSRPIKRENQRGLSWFVHKSMVAVSYHLIILKVLINRTRNNLFQDLLRYWNDADFSKTPKGFLYSLSEDRNHVCHPLSSDISFMLHELSKMYFSDRLCWLPLAQTHPNTQFSLWLCNCSPHS